MDLVFEVEREISGLSAGERLAVRAARSAPLVAELEAWMRSERVRLSQHSEVAKAMDYMLKRWDNFTRFLADGRICLTNNTAERALRGIALGRKSWLFAGSDRGGEARRRDLPILSHQERGQGRCVRLHRALLQRHQTSFDDRVSQPG